MKCGWRPVRYKTNLFVAAAPDIFLFLRIYIILPIFFHSSF
jgi:hypothetical protein